MNYYQLDNEILSSVQGLNGHQKIDILTYIKKFESPAPIHSHKLYRRRGMMQIREALENI